MDELPFKPKEPHQLARATDPGTSHEAGAKVIPDLRRLQEIVFNVLREHPGGLADPELDELCCAIEPRPYSTYRKRRGELVELGLVFNTGERKTIRGSTHIVWALTIRALQYIRERGL